MKKLLQQNKYYTGTIKLSISEMMVVSNDRLKSGLQDFGFADVSIEGTGKVRKVTGMWSKPSQEAEVPSQVVEINEI